MDLDVDEDVDSRWIDILFIFYDPVIFVYGFIEHL